MRPQRVLFIGGSGIISSACTAAGRRARGRRCTVLNRGMQPRPAAARGRAGAAGRRPRRRRRAPTPSATWSSTRSSTGWPSRPSTCTADLDLFGGPDGAVRLHQLGVGLPDAAGAAAGHRVDAAAQPVLAVLPRQDRLRGPARRRLPRARLARRRSSGPRTPTTGRRCRSTAAGRRIAPDAPGQAGRRPRRRHLAVDADPPRRLRPRLRPPARAPPRRRRGVPHHLRRRARPGTRSPQRSPRPPGCRPGIVHVPSDAIAAADPDWGAGLLGDKAHSMVFDNAKLRGLVPDYLRRRSRSSRAPARSSTGTTPTPRARWSTPGSTPWSTSWWRPGVPAAAEPTLLPDGSPPLR